MVRQAAVAERFQSAGFNGAAGSHRRMAERARGPSFHQTCFNGAAGSHRRMVLPSASNNAAMTASMGPPALTGGWTAGGPTSSSMWRSRFNGAAGSHRRMAGAMAPPAFVALPASMGPPALTGGWAWPRRDRAERHVASMGPPALTGGWSRATCCLLTRSSVLQWGRRLSPADGTQGGKTL